jgi:hypothetical protein
MEKPPLASNTLLARGLILSKVGGGELATLPILWVITRYLGLYVSEQNSCDNESLTVLSEDNVLGQRFGLNEEQVAIPIGYRPKLS